MLAILHGITKGYSIEFKSHFHKKGYKTGGSPIQLVDLLCARQLGNMLEICLSDVVLVT